MASETPATPAPTDAVNHPSHYNSHPSGIEAIDVCEAFNFNVGNTIKYAWRAGLKGDAVEDLRKAQWYLTREIARLERAERERIESPMIRLKDVWPPPH